MKALRRLGVVGLLLVLAHAVWSRSGRSVPEGARDPGLEVSLAGRDEGAGNLLAVQPYMVPADYASAERFQAKLDAYLAAAASRGLLNEKTVAVFPESLGSIVLPSPRVEAGRLVAGDGSLENVSAVFRPDGGVEDALARKAYPIEEEKAFLVACPLSGLPVFVTPAGRLGVLICADSWYPQAYRLLRAKKIDLLAVPSYAADDDCWNRPWHGYDGAPAPSDVDPADVGRLTEGQAWSRYALLGRFASSGARAGANVFLRGELWDLGDDGRHLGGD